MNGYKLIGVDIGGTKMKAAYIENSSVTKQHIIQTPAQESKDYVLNSLAACIEEVLTPEVKGIGVGVPGMVDTANGIIQQVLNIPSWKEVKLKEYLENRFHIPVFINNDANCFAAGEKYFGQAKDYSNFLGITLGTGVGSGIIINDNLYNGVNAGAGEIGYLPYKDSIFEHYCSSQFFSKFHHTTGIEVYKKILTGDTLAQEIMDEFGYHIGELIKRIVYVLAPEAVILGGSISKSFNLFEKSMLESIAEFPFPSIVQDLKVKTSQLDDISVLGAAALYYNSL